MSETRPLHRLFGLSWMDFFQGSSVTVETELDLSLKQQFLDLVLIRTEPGPMPDGFEELAAHNLVTFKSHQESLDAWALCELVGHYVNYRKQASPSLDDLLAETEFRLFAVCARFPQNLSQQVTMTPLRDGVYEVQALGLRIRVIVANQLAMHDNNAMLLLFSLREEQFRYGREHYRPKSPDTSTLLLDLFKLYSEESDMPDKLKEYVRESLERIMASTPLEQRIKGVSVDELLKALPPEKLEELKKKLKANGDSPPSESKEP